MRGLLPKLLLLGFSLALALVLCEGALRVARPQDLGIWRTTRDGQITLRPGLDAWLPSFGTRVSTNALGFRDEPVSKAKAPGAFRVIVLGDSFMEALQVPHEDSLPHRLGQILEARANRSVEVLNAGVSGWGTADELVWLHRVGLDLAPDLVLVAMTLHNDVSDNLELRHHDVVAGEPRPHPRVDMPLREYAPLEVKGWLAAHSHLYRLITETLRGREIRKRVGALSSHVSALMRREPDERIRLGWSLTRAHLDEIRAETGSRGARTAVFMIPLAVQLSDAAFEQFLASHDLTLDQVRLDQPQQQVEAWGSEAGVPVIDLLPAFRSRTAADSNPLYIPADGHWNQAGHELAAQALAEELIERELVPGRPTRRP
jgi:lysophospholipase L1-like esterase